MFLSAEKTNRLLDTISRDEILDIMNHGDALGPNFARACTYMCVVYKSPLTLQRSQARKPSVRQGKQLENSR